MELLNQGDIAVQHEYGLYGGADGEEVIDVLAALHVLSIVVAHTVPKSPTPHQRSVLETIAATAEIYVVVMSAPSSAVSATTSTAGRSHHSARRHGRRRRCRRQAVGAAHAADLGSLGPGKVSSGSSIAMASLRIAARAPRYVAGKRTHLKVPAGAEGEAYRDARRDQASRCGWAIWSASTPSTAVWPPSALIQSSAAVVLPYDSTEQVTSGVLVDAPRQRQAGHRHRLPARRRAVERRGRDQTTTTTRMRWPGPCTGVTQPRLAGSMASEARLLARSFRWPVVGAAYLALAKRLCSREAGAGMSTAIAPAPVFDHLLAMTDRRGTFEHACPDQLRPSTATA